jgi:hypothetical protein
MYATRSRFLADGILASFERRSWPTAERDAFSAPKESKTAIDIGARLRATVELDTLRANSFIDNELRARWSVRIDRSTRPDQLVSATKRELWHAAL